mmetsp:Transcript_22847/g.33421  ORF Transcript_22847/g.33421 Transcript_22847/m.33421 type:complete len:250 (-) Transcript_22847:135-884(-)
MLRVPTVITEPSPFRRVHIWSIETGTGDAVRRRLGRQAHTAAWRVLVQRRQTRRRRNARSQGGDRSGRRRLWRGGLGILLLQSKSWDGTRFRYEPLPTVRVQVKREIAIRILLQFDLANHILNKLVDDDFGQLSRPVANGTREFVVSPHQVEYLTEVLELITAQVGAGLSAARILEERHRQGARQRDGLLDDHLVIHHVKYFFFDVPPRSQWRKRGQSELGETGPRVGQCLAQPPRIRRSHLSVTAALE